jgi:hypothetical protein
MERHPRRHQEQEEGQQRRPLRRIKKPKKHQLSQAKINN